MFQFILDHIGNLFTLVGAAVGLVATWFRLVARVDALKILHGTDIDRLQNEMLMAGQANAKLRQDIERDLDRLKVLIETDLANFKASYIESRIQSSARNVSQQQEMKELRREIRELISENHKALIAEISWLKGKWMAQTYVVMRRKSGDQLSLSIRILSNSIRTIDELQLPEICKKLAQLERGLVVVSGPTGSGKTTTQAAMIQYINSNQTRHVLSFEDPIEYSHPSLKSKITQRELGGDTFSFAEALKHALRHDPDVIVVGEMRDSETAAAVIAMAETGHLVISTSHAPYSAQAVERIIDLFPHEERFPRRTRRRRMLP